MHVFSVLNCTAQHLQIAQYSYHASRWNTSDLVDLVHCFCGLLTVVASMAVGASNSPSTCQMNEAYTSHQHGQSCGHDQYTPHPTAQSQAEDYLLSFHYLRWDSTSRHHQILLKTLYNSIRLYNLLQFWFPLVKFFIQLNFIFSSIQLISLIQFLNSLRLSDFL